MINVNQVIKTLSQVRPVFYSEADFQHALAWQIHLQYPEYRVRLEYPVSPEQESNEYLDVLVFNNDYKVAIELKYKTSLFFAPIGGELFLLKNQDAQDQGRYDFLRDVQRLENLSKKPTIGYAIFLTNDSSYWRPSRNTSTASDSFRLTEGRKIFGTLNWGVKAGKGTIKDRELPIVLRGNYECAWQDYPNIAQHQYVKGSRQFRYLIFNVTRTIS